MKKHQLRFKWFDDPGPEYELVRTRRIRLRNGRVLLSTHYGLNCFTFWAKRRKR